MSFDNVVEVVSQLRDPENANLKDELGDVLLQVLLHSQLAKEAGQFSIDDVIENLTDKLIRRHPHVFGESDAKSIEEVEAQWQEIKKEERKSK